MTDPQQQRPDIPDFGRFVRFVEDCPMLEEAGPGPCMPRPCATCPFRRSSAPWVDAWRWLANVFRLREGRVQRCHNATALYCAGNVIAHGGGSADVYSAAEFERIEPAPSIDVSRDRYNAADFANTQRDAAKEIGRALSLPAAVVEEAGKGPA